MTDKKESLQPEIDTAWTEIILKSTLRHIREYKRRAKSIEEHNHNIKTLNESPTP